MATNLAAHVAQPHPGRADAQFIGMSDRARLIALFDLLAISEVDLVLFAHREPDAPAALRAWADARGVAVDERRSLCGASPMLCLSARFTDSHYRAVSVYIYE